MAVLLIAALLGCASPGGRPQSLAVTEKKAANASPGGWWYARFAMNWAEGTKPSWHLDPLLAHRVVSPVLDHYRNDIEVWRFHRRAARDQTGHQFSFIFYASQETARAVYAALQSNPLLGELKERGVVMREVYDDPGSNTRPNLEDTSDRHWPLSIQKSWPCYIQGASEMWLNLIVQVASESPRDNPSSNLDELLRFYEELNTTIAQLWRGEGQHAFLHHLNALFGYEPLMIRF